MAEMMIEMTILQLHFNIDYDLIGIKCFVHMQAFLDLGRAPQNTLEEDG
jgi:hypothetical protein